MAIASPSAPSFSPSFCRIWAESPAGFARFPSIALAHTRRTRTHPLARRLAVSSRLNSSTPSGAGGSISPDNGDMQYELFHGFSPQRRTGSPVYVTLPVDAVGSNGQVRRRKAMVQSFRALALAGVEGVVMEVWWGLVERNQPMFYDWSGYSQIVELARKCGLKIRALLAFHQCGTSPDEPHWLVQTPSARSVIF